MSEPKNLIKEKLFSQGELWLNNSAYTGPYNISADGTYYTLSKFVEGKSQILKTNRVSLYQRLLKQNNGVDISEKNAQVVNNTRIPTLEDYEKGFYTRYFIKRKDSNNISEVEEMKLGDIGEKISEVLYVGFELNWKISGPLDDRFDSKGVRQEAGVRDTNRRTLQRLEKQHTGISEKLQNLTQFYRKF